MNNLTPNRINLLILLYQKYNNNLALNKLWEFYFPLIKETILYNIIKNYPGVEDHVQDIIDDSYEMFVNAICNYTVDSYCFSSYIEEFIEREIISNIKKYNDDYVK
jgi:DNA-directed RNA polymerase specialized sigma subunit